MTLFYDIFIYPLEFLMGLVLKEALSITGSPLISLVILSFAVSLGSLPFYHIAETWQDREREIQKKLKPKIKELKSAYKGTALKSYISTLYRQNNYHPLMSIRTSFGLLIQIPFFFAAYHLLSNYIAFNGVETLLFKDLGTPDAMIVIAGFSINVLPFIMTLINLASAFVYAKKTTINESMQPYGMALLFLVVLYNSPSALLFYWTINSLIGLIKNIFYNKIYDNGIITTKNTAESGSKDWLKLYALVLVSISLLIFISSPMALLVSGSQEDIPGTFQSYFKFMLTGFTLSMALGTMLWKIIPEKTRAYWVIFLTVIFFSGTVSSFIFNPDYGEMAGFVFERSPQIQFLEIILSFVAVFSISAAVIYLYIKKKSQLLRSAAAVVLFSLILFTVYNGYLFYKTNDQSASKSESAIKKEFVFSKSGRNVIVIMLDRFIGGYVPDISEILPEMEDILDGFVWYPSALSPGSDTLSGKPCILGGWEYHGKTISETRRDTTLLEKMSESVRIMPYNFLQSGFDASIFDSKAGWLRGSDNKFIEEGTIKTIVGKHTNAWLKIKNLQGIKDDSDERIITYSIFRFSPSFLRTFFYENKKSKKNKKEYVHHDSFFVTFKETNKSLMNGSLREWSTFDLLPEISEALPNVKDQFLYFSTLLTHEPFITDIDLNISLSGHIRYPQGKYQQFNKDIKSLKHLYTDAAAIKMLGRWFEWMKENEVYDNSRIILVSDHGRNVFDPMFKKRKIPSSKKKNSPASWHILLMVKDFNSSGKMQTKNDFMSNCDVPYLAMENIVEGKNPYTGNAITIPENKMPYTLYKTKFRIKEQEKYDFAKTESFVINNGDIFDLSNWSLIE